MGRVRSYFEVNEFVIMAGAGETPDNECEWLADEEEWMDGPDLGSEENLRNLYRDGLREETPPDYTGSNKRHDFCGPEEFEEAA